MKILLVEDASDLALSVQHYFQNENYICEIASTFEQAREKVIIFDYDIIILDIMLPDGNGINFLKILKKEKEYIPVIIASAKNSLDFKLSGLDEGADDYITKPFALAELHSRIKAVLRRHNKTIQTNLLSYNEIEVNLDSFETKVNNISIILTKKETNMLVFFIQNQNRIVSRQTIANHLWGDYTDNLDNFDFVYQHMKNLRKKITEAGGADYINTVYGLGYKFGENDKVKS